MNRLRIAIGGAGTGRAQSRLHEKFREMYGHGPEDVEALAGSAFPRGGVRWKVAGWD